MSLGGVIAQAVELRAQMRASGTPNLEQAFEDTIRSVWPFTREWKYVCDDCRDIGLEILTCAGAGGPCGRRQDHNPHEFARPCWCAKGANWKQKPKSAEDALAIAARVPKPSRFGR